MEMIIAALRSSRNRRPVPGGRIVNCCRCEEALVVSPAEFDRIEQGNAKPACPPCYGRIIRSQQRASD